MNAAECVHPSVHRHLAFTFSALIDKAAPGIPVRVFGWTQALVSAGQRPRGGIAGSQGMCTLSSGRCCPTGFRSGPTDLPCVWGRIDLESRKGTM